MTNTKASPTTSQAVTCPNPNCGGECQPSPHHYQRLDDQGQEIVAYFCLQCGQVYTSEKVKAGK